MGDILLSSYIAKNRKGANFTDAELKALKEGNLDNMVSIFVPMKNDKYVQQLQCVLKSMRYYMGEDVSLLQVNLEDNHREHFVGCQMMDGDEEVFFAIGGSDDALIKVASRFAQVDFDEFDSDAYDTICEFINCTNGMFATKLSDQEIEVILRPPVFYGDASISGDNGFYVVTMEIDGTEFNVIMSVSDKVRLKTIKTNCV